MLGPLDCPAQLVAAAGEYFHLALVDMKLDAVAVELDFVNPARTVWEPLNRRCQGRLDEAGPDGLDAESVLPPHHQLHVTVGIQPG